jgi:hypothetical protein
VCSRRRGQDAWCPSARLRRARRARRSATGSIAAMLERAVLLGSRPPAPPGRPPRDGRRMGPKAVICCSTTEKKQYVSYMENDPRCMHCLFTCTTSYLGSQNNMGRDGEATEPVSVQGTRSIEFVRRPVTDPSPVPSSELSCCSPPPARRGTYPRGTGPPPPVPAFAPPQRATEADPCHP